MAIPFFNHSSGMQFFYVICTDGGKQSDEGGTGEDEEYKRKKYVLAGRPSV